MPTCSGWSGAAPDGRDDWLVSVSVKLAPFFIVWWQFARYHPSYGVVGFEPVCFMKSASVALVTNPADYQMQMMSDDWGDSGWVSVTSDGDFWKWSFGNPGPWYDLEHYAKIKKNPTLGTDLNDPDAKFRLSFDPVALESPPYYGEATGRIQIRRSSDSVIVYDSSLYLDYRELDVTLTVTNNVGELFAAANQPTPLAFTVIIN